MNTGKLCRELCSVDCLEVHGLNALDRETASHGAGPANTGGFHVQEDRVVAAEITVEQEDLPGVQGCVPL